MPGPLVTIPLQFFTSEKAKQSEAAITLSNNRLHSTRRATHRILWPAVAGINLKPMDRRAEAGKKRQISEELKKMQRETMESDVVIVGAGPAGLSAAAG